MLGRRAAADQRRLLTIAAACGALMVVCTAVATAFPDYPEALWWLLVPVGILGSMAVCITALTLAVVARVRAPTGPE